MGRLAGLRARLRALLLRRAAERDLDDEFRFHLEMEVEKNLRAGMDPAEARRRARLAFGGVEKHREAMRDGRRVAWLEDAAQDARFALRALRRSPGFTAVSVLTLGLGIGASATVFAAVDAVLLAPLPYPRPDRLVRIFEQNSPTNRWTISNADWQAIEAQQRSFDAAVLLSPGGAAMSTTRGAEWVDVGRATAGLFRTLGIEPARGRGFRAGEDRPGAAPVVVLREGFWERHFGDGDPVGRSLVLDGVTHTVVGVLPRGTERLAGLRADVWPILQLPTPTRRGPFGYVGIARLRDGVTLEAAARDLAGISERIYPIWAEGFRDRTARLTPYSLREVIVADAERSLTVLGLAVGLVLLIAIANVANLVLVRASGRRQEMAVRGALGARRSRLARLLLTESLVLAALGGAAGLAVAALGLRVLPAVGPSLPRVAEAGLDLRVVGFAALAALLSGVGVGSYPLLFGGPRAAAASLRGDDRRSGPARGTRLFQGSVVAAEFALALPLLLGAGLLLQSLLRLQRVDPGFETRNLLAARVSLPAASGADPEAALRFWEAVVREVREVPGVTGAGLTTSLPPDNQGDVNNFDLLEKPVPPGGAEPTAPWSWVSPELFPTLGVPLLEGRLLEPTDDADAPPVVLVSRAWAERHFPGESAVGKRLYAGGCRTCTPSTVVGVVGDVKYEGLAGSADGVYEPLAQSAARELHLVVRTAVAPASLAAAVRERIRALDPDVPVHDLTTMEERVSSSIADPRRLAWLLGAFAATAVVLAGLGVFGVMSYAVRQRRQEIGIRIALGAAPGAVVGMVLRRGLLQVGAGLLLGLLVFSRGMRVLEGVLFGVAPADPLTLAGVPLLLLAVAALACWLPGRRAARIDPVEAIASE